MEQLLVKSLKKYLEECLVEFSGGTSEELEKKSSLENQAGVPYIISRGIPGEMLGIFFYGIYGGIYDLFIYFKNNLLENKKYFFKNLLEKFVKEDLWEFEGASNGSFG